MKIKRSHMQTGESENRDQDAADELNQGADSERRKK